MQSTHHPRTAAGEMIIGRTAFLTVYACEQAAGGLYVHTPGDAKRENL